MGYPHFTQESVATADCLSGTGAQPRDWRSHDASLPSVLPGSVFADGETRLKSQARGIVSLDSSAAELLRADPDEAELAVPGILAVVEKGQE
jgi:hypothetical protein